MNPYIFRKYDIRGVVKTDFSDDIVIKLGQGYGTFVRRKGGKKVALSGDVRQSTPHLKAKFAEGLLSTGVDIIDLGIVPTPVNYYSMFKLPVDGAAQITGSHNPPEMNGFKLNFDRKSVYGDDIQKIRQMIEKKDFARGKGHSEKRQILADYIEEVVSKIQLEKSVQTVMDCGNAAAGLAAPQIFDQIGCQTKKLYCDIDGTFPNHHPDPTVEENIADLIAAVKEGDYDFGVAFDGDGDRIGIVDNTGKIIWADYIMILFLDEIIKNNETIVFDVKCSQALEDVIHTMGGTPLMWKTGHSLIKEKMREVNAPFAGEMSGHICFADDYYGFDDAIYAAARFAQMVSRHTESIAKLMQHLPHYYSTPEMRLECADDKAKFEIAEKSAQFFKNHHDCIDVDGVRIKFGDGWGLVRASNTQPVIVTRFEAKTKERLKEIKDYVLNKLSSFGDISI